MYRILIVDDESYFRQYLKSTVSWADLGFEIAGEASNGEDALDLIPQIKPEVILADIHMTEMDGIAFSKEVKRRYPYISIILITGYNEFEYARQAIKIGVSNFLSKPIDKQELIDGVLKIKKEIISTDNREKLISTLQQRCDETMPLVRDSVLYRFIKGGYDPEQMQSDLKRLSISVPSCPSVVIAAEYGADPEGDRETRKNIGRYLLEHFCAILHMDCVAFAHEELILCVAGLGAPRFIGYLKDCCSGIIKECTDRFGGFVSIGIGDIAAAAGQLPSSHSNAMIALHNKFLLGNNRVISYDSLKISGMGKEIYPFELKNDLLMYFRLLDDQRVEKTMMGIYTFIRNKPVSIDFIYILYTELLSNCLSCLAEYGCKNNEVFGAGFSPFVEILNGRTVKEVHEYVVSVYMKAIFYLKNRKKQKSISTVKKAKEYIDLNYAVCNLTVEKIAENVFFHPSYLRFLFKKQMGMTVSEYVTQVRMEHAKQILAQGKFSNMAVASMVGYSDSAYFSKCFKKYYKINPSEFEKRSSPDYQNA